MSDYYKINKTYAELESNREALGIPKEEEFAETDVSDSIIGTILGFIPIGISWAFLVKNAGVEWYYLIATYFIPLMFYGVLLLMIELPIILSTNLIEKNKNYIGVFNYLGKIYKSTLKMIISPKERFFKKEKKFKANLLNEYNKGKLSIKDIHAEELKMYILKNSITYRDFEEGFYKKYNTRFLENLKKYLANAEVKPCEKFVTETNYLIENIEKVKLNIPKSVESNNTFFLNFLLSKEDSLNATYTVLNKSMELDKDSENMLETLNTIGLKISELNQDLQGINNNFSKIISVENKLEKEFTKEEVLVKLSEFI